MKIKTGIDIVNRKRFQASLKAGKEAFLDRLFLPQELRQNTPDQLASIFALKEAIMKALDKPRIWHSICTNRKASGKVECSFTDVSVAQMISSLDTSIAHEGEWIIAVVVIVMRH